jgi:hypothetical protein
MVALKHVYLDPKYFLENLIYIIFFLFFTSFEPFGSPLKDFGSNDIVYNDLWAVGYPEGRPKMEKKNFLNIFLNGSCHIPIDASQRTDHKYVKNIWKKSIIKH